MLNVLHIYDNEPVILGCSGTLLDDDDMVYSVYDILALSPEIFASRPFNLLIFDVFGKDKSYLSLFKKIRTWIEISGAPRPPIIVIADKDSELSEESARMEGADFFFIKPVGMEELVSVFTQISKRNKSK